MICKPWRWSCIFWTQIPKGKPWKALLASVLRTKHTAPEKKPPDRSKAARPGGVEKRRCTRHAALTVRVGTAPIQKVNAWYTRLQLLNPNEKIWKALLASVLRTLHLWNPIEKPWKAPLRIQKLAKFRQAFSHGCSFISKYCFVFFAIIPKFTNIVQY